MQLYLTLRYHTALASSTNNLACIPYKEIDCFMFQKLVKKQLTTYLCFLNTFILQFCYEYILIMSFKVDFQETAEKKVFLRSVSAS